MDDKNKFDEPWTENDEGMLVDCNGNYVYEGDYGCDVKFDHRNRAKDCVNALSGLDPLKLAGLIQAAEAVVKHAEYFEDCCGYETGMGVTESIFEDFKSALAALKDDQGRPTRLWKQLSETRPGLYFEENGLIGDASALLWYNGRVIHVMHPAAWIAWKSGTYTATHHVCLGVSTLKFSFGPHQTITIVDCGNEKTYRLNSPPEAIPYGHV